MSNIKQQFESLLATFVKSTQQSMEAASELAKITILQFEEHGDLSYAQTFVEAMPKNYIRRQAFLKWLCDYSPAIMGQDGKLVKDKSPDAVEYNTTQALLVDFWEYAPEPETINFGANDVVVALNRTIAKFGKTTKSGKARYHDVGNGLIVLEMARGMVGDLAEAAQGEADKAVEVQVQEPEAPVEETAEATA